MTQSGEKSMKHAVNRKAFLRILIIHGSGLIKKSSKRQGLPHSLAVVLTLG